MKVKTEAVLTYSTMKITVSKSFASLGIMLLLFLACSSGRVVEERNMRTGGIRGSLEKSIHWQSGCRALIQLHITKEGVNIDSLAEISRRKLDSLRGVYAEFFPETDFVVFKNIDPDGTFEARGLPEGTYSAIFYP
jgi:hypothetical protein